MTANEIRIARDFSTKPVGRYYEDGPNTGQRFREEFLIPALEKGDDLVILLDGTEGYPSSFIDEAFGGLVRLGRWRLEELRRRVKIEAHHRDFEPYRDRILAYFAKK